MPSNSRTSFDAPTSVASSTARLHASSSAFSTSQDEGKNGKLPTQSHHGDHEEPRRHLHMLDHLFHHCLAWQVVTCYQKESLCYQGRPRPNKAKHTNIERLNFVMFPTLVNIERLNFVPSPKSLCYLCDGEHLVDVAICSGNILGRNYLWRSRILILAGHKVSSSLSVHLSSKNLTLTTWTILEYKKTQCDNSSMMEMVLCIIVVKFHMVKHK
jgi:hypothetical protein